MKAVNGRAEWQDPRLGDELLRRFSAAEAAAAWGALSAIDSAMRAAGEQFEPGFQV